MDNLEVKVEDGGNDNMVEVGGEDKVDEVEEESVLTKDEMVTAGFSTEEISMYEKQKPVKKEEGSEQKNKDDSSVLKKELSPEEKIQEQALIKKAESDEELTPEEDKAFHLLNRNAAGLYRKQKKEHQKRQDIQQERDLLKVKLSILENQVAEITKKTDKPEDVVDNDPERALTVGELDKRESDRLELQETKEAEQAEKNKVINAKLSGLAVEGRGKYPDFDVVSGLAGRVVDTGYAKDVKVRVLYNEFRELLNSDAETAESDMAEIVYELGKRHPEYKSAKPDDKPSAEDKVKAEKILANQAKQKSSASIGGSGGGSKQISEDDLTPQEAVKRWNTLSPKTRERILREVG